MLQNQLLLSISEFSRYLGVGTATIRRWESEGKLQGVVRTVGGQRRIPASEVSRILNLPKPKPVPYLCPIENGFGEDDTEQSVDEGCYEKLCEVFKESESEDDNEAAVFEESENDADTDADTDAAE